MLKRGRLRLSAGRELFLWQESSLASIPVDLEDERPKHGERRVLFNGAGEKLEALIEFEVAPEGSFLLAQSPEYERPADTRLGILVVENRAHELVSPNGPER